MVSCILADLGNRTTITRGLRLEPAHFPLQLFRPEQIRDSPTDTPFRSRHAGVRQSNWYPHAQHCQYP